MESSLKLRVFEYAMATWTMKRPRRHRDLELGARDVRVSTKIIPNDGREHTIALVLSGGILQVLVDGVCISREQLSRSPKG